MRRLRVAALVLAATLVPGFLAFAQSQNSPNFQNLNSSLIPVLISSQSASYKLDAAMDPIVGTTQSPSFISEAGSQNDDGTPVVVVTPPTSGGGGGGGGGDYVPWPTPTSTAPTGTLLYVWVYRSTYNGTPLHLGDNLVGNTIVHRRLIGDVNDDRIVDDIDLSLFTRMWKVYDRQADFNEDGLIDDIDLSLFASHWYQRY